MYTKPHSSSMASSFISNIITITFLPAYICFACFRMCIKLPMVPAIWAIKRINPSIVDDVTVTKNNFKKKIKNTADKSITTLSSLIAKIILLAASLIMSLVLSTIMYAVVYYLIMPKDLQETQLYFHVQEKDASSSLHKSQPGLVSLTPIGNSMAGYYSVTGDKFNVHMEQEYYNIDAVFSVVESHQNYNQGNIFVNAKFTSYNSALQPVSFSRMGSLNYKGSLQLYVKEIIRLIPFSSYFLNIEPKQEVVIKIVENFNNKEYPTSTIELQIANSAPQFTKAVLRIRSSLFGIRYLMREWFYGFGMFAIGISTFTMFLGTIAFYLIIKDSIKVFLLRLYPESTPKRPKSPMTRTKGHLGGTREAMSDAPTEDVYSSDDDYNFGSMDSRKATMVRRDFSMERGKCMPEKVVGFLISALI